MERETNYYKELIKLRTLKQEILKWVCAIFLISILESILGGYKTAAVLVLILVTYGLIKQILEYRSNEVISDKQVAFLLITGFLSFLGIVQIITSAELY